MTSFREDYNNEEWPENFINNWRQPDIENFANLFQLHRFIKSLTKSGKYLEIGSGPSPIGIFSASIKFDDITLSDFSDVNIDCLKKWKTVDDLDNIRTLVQYVSALEGRDINEMNENALKSVKKISQSDLLNHQIIPNDDSKYDVISMNFVLLSACKTEEDLMKSLKNVYNKLNPGGVLYDYGAVKQQNYQVGEKTFAHYCIDSDKLVNIVEEVGFKVSSYGKFVMSVPTYFFIASC
ncbi:unnamed protein product [Dimorphilus gyrociliatus]|uniref:Uncharacterized protein n=1 Tax=Dimorphilus gyrociliatus TaxID=2664684 RepID=A0A7I8WF76_9ANNE|nr:unnamed protein product [Dimorphilus gyrociliatus]